MIQLIEAYTIQKKDFSICKHCFADLIMYLAIGFFAVGIPFAPFAGLFVYFHPSELQDKLTGFGFLSLVFIISALIGSFGCAVYVKSRLPITLIFVRQSFYYLFRKKENKTFH